eukprot:338691_1
MSTFVLIVHLLCIRHSSSTTFNTDQENQYSNSNLTCESDQNCSIMCDKHWSCDRSNIFCPNNAQCSIACTSDKATAGGTCVNMMIDCRHSTECDITCNALQSTKAQSRYACNGMVVLCPTNGSCHVSCTSTTTEYAAYACSSAFIIWSTNKDAIRTLDCIGDRSCSQVALPIFYNQNNADFYVNCTYDGAGSECAWSTIHCPLYAGCFITCHSYRACMGTTVNWVHSQQYSLSCIGNDCLQLGAATNTSTTQTYWNCTYDPMRYPDQSCSRHMISCYSDKPCTIHCKGDQTCEWTVINALSASDTTVYCHPYGPEVCETLSIHCGYGNCSVYCMGDMACGYIQLMCGEGSCSLYCGGHINDPGSSGCRNVRVFTSIRSKFNCYGECVYVNVIPTPRYPTVSPTMAIKEVTYVPSQVPTTNPTVSTTMAIKEVTSVPVAIYTTMPTHEKIPHSNNDADRKILWILVAIIGLLVFIIAILCWKRFRRMRLRLNDMPLLQMLQRNNEGEGEGEEGNFQREGHGTEYVG